MLRKVIFQLEPGEDGYPPVGAESVWAAHIEGDSYRIENIPFFAKEATLDDIIEAVEVDGALEYKRTLRRSGNSLIRVHCWTGVDQRAVQRDLEALGCTWEGDNNFDLIAINVPPDVPLEKVQAFLQQGFEQERFDYEEAILMQ